MNPQQAAAYFEANPDVAAAFAANSYGLTPEKFADAHWVNFGQGEGRSPSFMKLAAEPAAPAAPAAPVQPRLGTLASGATKQTPTIAEQTQGASYSGETPAQVAQRVQAAQTPEDAYRAQRAAEVAAANAPKDAYSAWVREMERQPWYKDWQRQTQQFGTNPGDDSWGYNPRTDKWTNHKNALIERYGTADPYEYAVKQGMAPPPGVQSGTGWDYTKAWAADPKNSTLSTVPHRETAPFWQDINARREQIAAKNATKSAAKGLVSGASGVAPTPPKPEPSEEVDRFS